MNRTHATAKRRRSDRGYAVIMSSLLLVPLMGFAGFAVDVGAWYSRASAIQRAADAASLAGVVWQPDFSTAEFEAREAAARNGFVDGVDGIIVTVIDAGNNQIEVSIEDTDVDMFFAGLFLSNMSIERGSTSEYTKSIPMGNPENYLGTDPERGISEQNYLSVSGAATGKKGGDRHASGACDSTTALCSNGSTGNLAANGGEFLENGYMYAVRVDGLQSYPLVMEVYDPGFYSANQTCGNTGNMPAGYDFNDLLNGDLRDLFGSDGVTDAQRVAHWTERYANTPGAIYCSGDTPANGAGSVTSFVVRQPDNTPFNIFDNPIITSGTCSPTQFDAYDEDFYALLESVDSADTSSVAYQFAQEFRRWANICVIPAGTVVEGDYYIQVRTNAAPGAPTVYDPSYSQGGRNHFSLRAGWDTGGSAPDGTGVEVFAEGTMSIDVNVPAATTLMELARVTPEYAGRTLSIELWDVGDASQPGVLTILPPTDATGVTFSNCRFTNTRAGWSDADPTDCATIVSGQMNGNLLTIEVDLPAGYTCNDASAVGCYVRVQVAFPSGTSVYDHTTWSVKVVGDPVRLLE